jgi:hypothetical protein
MGLTTGTVRASPALMKFASTSGARLRTAPAPYWKVPMVLSRIKLIMSSPQVICTMLCLPGGISAHVTECCTTAISGRIPYPVSKRGFGILAHSEMLQRLLDLHALLCGLVVSR